MRKQTWYDQVLSVITTISVCILLCLICVNAIQAVFTVTDAQFLENTQSKWGIAYINISMTVFLGMLFYLSYRLFKRLDEAILHLICIGCIAAIFIGQCVFLFYYQSLYMWDSAYVVGGATNLLEKGRVAQEAYYYYSIYPNQNAFAVLTEFLLGIGKFFGIPNHKSCLLLNSFSLISIDVSILFTSLILKKTRPNFSMAKWTTYWFFIAMQPIIYIGVSYYYTVTLSMPYVMGFVYLVLILFTPKQREEEFSYPEDIGDRVKRYISWGLVVVVCALCFAVGYLIRAILIIPMIAFVFCALICPRGKNASVEDAEYQLRVAMMVGTLLLAILFSLGLKSLVNAKVGVDSSESAFPATHWVMMSLTSPGCHNAEDEQYTASFATFDEKKEAVAKRMSEKMQAMSLSDWGKLIWNKEKNTWASGENSYVLFMENCLRMDGLYPYLFGTHNDFMIVYQQGMLLLVLAGMLVFGARQLVRKDALEINLFFLQLCLLGAYLFYLIWETSGQYSLPFLFIMILLAIVGFGSEEEENQEYAYQIKLFQQSSESVLNRQAFHNKIYQVLAGMGVLVFVGMLLFFGGNYKKATQVVTQYSDPVVNQLIANTQTEPVTTLTQSFQTAQSFNQLAFQWRNDNVDDNDSVYELTLLGPNQKVIATKTLQAQDSGYAGAVVLCFDQVVPEKMTSYEIKIQKISGKEEKGLSFVTYRCGSFDPYPMGELVVNEAPQLGDMMLQVSFISDRAYATKKHYVFFVLILTIVFLFFEICCILHVCVKKDVKWIPGKVKRFIEKG